MHAERQQPRAKPKPQPKKIPGEAPTRRSGRLSRDSAEGEDTAIIVDPSTGIVNDFTNTDVVGQPEILEDIVMHGGELVQDDAEMADLEIRDGVTATIETVAPALSSKTVTNPTSALDLSTLKATNGDAPMMESSPPPSASNSDVPSPAITNIPDWYTLAYAAFAKEDLGEHYLMFLKGYVKLEAEFNYNRP